MATKYKYELLNRIFEIQVLQNSKKKGIKTDFLAELMNKPAYQINLLSYKAEKRGYIFFDKKNKIVKGLTDNGLKRIKWIRELNNLFTI